MACFVFISSTPVSHSDVLRLFFPSGSYWKALLSNVYETFGGNNVTELQMSVYRGEWARYSVAPYSPSRQTQPADKVSVL